MAGQMSLFDLVGEESREAFEIALPDVGEYGQDMLLAFEKEVLGVYVSGHPLEQYQALWERCITAKTSDFYLNEETGSALLGDGRKVTVGGLIADKKIKYTKNDKVMAFLTLEDLVGTIEVVIFPRDYELNSAKLIEDAKVFITGRVSAEEDKDAKLICERISFFEDIPRSVWIKFPTKEAYQMSEDKLKTLLWEQEGKDSVVIYIEDIRAKKELDANWNIRADAELMTRLADAFGEQNVKIAYNQKFKKA